MKNLRDRQDYNGNELIHLLGHSGTIMQVEFSPNNEFVVTSSMDNTKRIWKIPKSSFVLNGNKGELTRATFLSSGNYITTSNTGEIIIWNKEGVPLKTLSGHSIEKNDLIRGESYTNLYISPDENHFVTTSSDSAFILWTINGQKLFQKKTEPTWGYSNNIAFMPDGKSFVAVSLDTSNIAIRYSIKGDTIAQYFQSVMKKDEVFVAISNDGKMVAFTMDSTIFIFRPSGELININKEKNYYWDSPKFSPDNNFLLIAGLSPLSGPIVAKLGINGKKLFECKGHTGGIYSIEFSPDNKYFVTSSNDNTARVWDTTGSCIAVLKGHSAFLVYACFSPDGKYILTTSLDKTARIWNLNGEMIQELKGHTDKLWSAVYSPDGKYVLTASGDKTARIWAVDPEEILRLVNEEKVYGTVRQLIKDEKKEFGINE